MNKSIIYLIIVILLSSCVSKKNISKIDTGYRGPGQDAEYYLTFTEATKHALIGNYQNAVTLYNLCIEKFPERAGPYYQLSNIYYSFKDMDKAKFFGNKAMNLDIENKWYLLHLANIYQLENNIDSLIYLYEKIVDITDNPEYKYNLSVFYSHKGDVKKSMNLVKTLEKEIQDAREILRLKHMNYSKLNMQDSAIVQLEKLIKLFPGDIENYGLLAEYLSEIDRYKYAGKLYKELLFFEPGNGLANFSYADFFLKQGKKDSALVYYKKGFAAQEITIEDKISLIFNFLYDPVSIQQDSLFITELLAMLKVDYPHDERSYTLSAEFNIKRRNYELALIDLEQAIKLNIDSYLVWEQYIMISSLTNDYQRVYSIYNEAINKFPKEINLYIYSGYGLYELKKYNELIVLCDTALNIEKLPIESKIQIINLKADAYRQLKDYSKSNKLYEEILTVDAENLVIRNNYAYYLSIRGERLDYAEELSRLTIQREPNNATYLDTFAWINFLSGDTKEALRYIQKALKNGANSNSEVLDHYARILLSIGKCSEAVEAWKYAIKYDPSTKEVNLINITNAEEICK